MLRQLPERCWFTNKKPGTKDQEDINKSPDSDVKEPLRSRPGHRNPQDLRMRYSTEVGKQISKPGGKQTQHGGEYKVP